MGRKARTVGGERKARGAFGGDAGLCVSGTQAAWELACLAEVPVAITSWPGPRPGGCLLPSELSFSCRKWHLKAHDLIVCWISLSVVTCLLHPGKARAVNIYTARLSFSCLNS